MCVFVKRHHDCCLAFIKVMMSEESYICQLKLFSRSQCVLATYSCRLQPVVSSGVGMIEQALRYRKFAGVLFAIVLISSRTIISH